MKNNILLAIAVFVMVLTTVAGCAEKSPSGPCLDCPTRTATITQTWTITKTFTISTTATVTKTQTVSPTMTSTATGTATRTATVTRTSTPLTTGIYAGAHIGSYDTFISKVASESGNNYGGCGFVLIAANSPGTDVQRGILRFGVINNIPVLPSNIVAVNIKMVLNAATTGSGTIEVYKLTQAFTEGKFCDAASTTTATWTSANSGYDAAILGSVSFTNGIASGTILSIPIAVSVLQDWHDNDATNYGVMLRLTNETPAALSAASFYAAAWPYASAANGLEVLYYP